MTFPVWTAEYFRWQVGDAGRQLAIYDDDKPIAVLLGTSVPYRSSSESFRAAHWSWLSVADSYRGCGLATRLDDARVQLERKDASELIVSYRFNGSRHSLAERPTEQFPLKRFHSRLGFWARPLDGRKLHQWNVNRVEGFLSRVWTPLLPKASTPFCEGIRAYAASDLQACRLATTSQFRNCALRVDWNDSLLRHQLSGSAISQTIVAEHNGGVGGFINFHILPFQGRTREPVAVIDLICVNQLPFKKQLQLLNSAFGCMREQGAILALKIRCGDVGWPLMLASGFTPRWPDSSLVLQWTQKARSIPKRKPLHLLWR